MIRPTLALPETFGDLKRLLRDSPSGEWPSRVNPSMTHRQALEVLKAAIDLRPDDMLITAEGRGDLMMRNVLRECRTRTLAKSRRYCEMCDEWFSSKHLECPECGASTRKVGAR